DVGHQAYGHKMLTGRRRFMQRIKKGDGPSGFLRRSESEYDVFGAGHAGTSVSAGLGISEATARLGGSRRSVVVIGDGAATSGMSFEALNHAGELERPLLVVFNDNGMSIAPNVGGLSKTDRAREYFEALGLDYVGPIDGHDVDLLVDELGRLREITRATVLHVRTKKGRGYAPAEADPFGWHATGAFDIASGKRKASSPSASKSAPTWTAVFADVLSYLADRDPRMVAITAAMPDGTGLDRFALTHPDRVYDVGIAEQHAVTFAAGLATEGLRPVCAIYSSFLQRAFDQVVHDVALQRLPVIFAMDRAGLVGADGPTHHGLLDLAYLRVIPGMVVAAPRDPVELQRLMVTALAENRPFAIRFPRGAAPVMELEDDARPFPVGRGELLRSGDDVALVALGKTVDAALEAADVLAEAGVSAAVADARFVKPLDACLLGELAESCGRVVTIEDHSVHGGLGSAVLELFAERGLRPEVKCLGVGDAFVDHGDTDGQWKEVGIDPQSIAVAARDLVKGRDGRALPPSWPGRASRQSQGTRA
ncbi:MAG: 1-deoxy-D-xylulose-5-phosphate synthase, partial [Myxococcales bacterium]